MTMSIPVWVLLAFAVWSMLVLILTVGIYRWGLIFAGRVQANEGPTFSPICALASFSFS
ncbi:MAG: hypothetical protein OEM15_14410 [Myxococcales bacterium]|nr:hypothetical protein [Myxococcales bacterium]MDH3483209.1 hypothetical protein [Myxococcales bacterium]